MSRYYGEKPKHIVVDDPEVFKTSKKLAVELDMKLKDYVKYALRNYNRLMKRKIDENASD